MEVSAGCGCLSPPVEKAPVEASPVASFIIPCRNHFLGKCRFGSTCKFQHTQLTSVSDELFDYFIKNHIPFATKDDIVYLWGLSQIDKLAVVNGGEMDRVEYARKCSKGRMNSARQNEAPVDRPYSASRKPRRRSRPRTRSRSRRISRSPSPQSGALLADPPAWQPSLKDVGKALVRQRPLLLKNHREDPGPGPEAVHAGFPVLRLNRERASWTLLVL